MVADISNWEDMRSKPVAILGGGVSGQGVQKLLNRLNWKSKIFDEKGVPLNYSRLKNCSIVVTNPGFSPDHPGSSWFGKWIYCFLVKWILLLISCLNLRLRLQGLMEKPPFLL